MLKEYFSKEAITSHPLYMDGHCLSADDNWRVRCSLVLHLLLIQDASVAMEQELLLFGHSGILRVCSDVHLGRLRDDVLSQDLRRYYGELKKLLLVYRHLPFDLAGRIGPCKIRKTIRRLFAEYEVDPSAPICKFILPFFTIYLKTDCLGMLEGLNDILQFESHLTLKDVEWIEDDEIQKYRDMEAYLRRLRYPTQLLEDMRGTILQWLCDFHFIHTTPHGYGATAEVPRGKGTAAKREVVLSTLTQGNIRTLLATGWIPAPGQWSPLGEWLTACSVNPAVISHFPTESAPGKYNLVPKGVDSKRGVSMEPTCNMFAQGAIMSSLIEFFEENKHIGYTPRSQERSQRFALLGSWTREYGTIDLSSASDTVTNTLVRVLLHSTELYTAMLGCRTTHVVLPDGGVVALEKWAPMGSKLCFPIMSLILCALIHTVQLNEGYHYPYVVYGDDLVVHRCVFDKVVQALTQLGFLINESKSYPPASGFKEACGMEAVKGHPVIPVRIGRKFDPIGAEHLLRDPHRSCTEPYSTQLGVLYQLGNDLFQKGYLRTRKAVIQLTQHLYPGCLFTHYFEQDGFYTPGEITHPYQRRRPIMFQGRVLGHAIYAKHQVLSADQERGSRIQCYWASVEKIENRIDPADNPPSDGWVVRSRVGPTTTKLIWKWVPVVQFE